MTTGIIEIRTLTPDEGMRLTNGTVVADGTVYLGKDADPNEWREVTEAEAEEMKRMESAESTGQGA